MATTTTATETTETVPTETERTMGDRIVTYLVQEEAAYHAELRARGLTRVEAFAVGVEINRIATDLNVPHEAINGALAHLYHPVPRVVGTRVHRQHGMNLWVISLVKTA